MAKLKPEYQELSDEFEIEYSDRGCTCFQCAPCSYCTHPGNPDNLNETPEAWENDKMKLQDLEKVTEIKRTIRLVVERINALNENGASIRCGKGTNTLASNPVHCDYKDRGILNETEHNMIAMITKGALERRRSELIAELNDLGVEVE